ncbi:MAG: dihydrofolate reductase family protein [Herpetosiphon sp.]
MAELIYAAITSLDGYIEDQDGTFDWAVPDDEVHQCVNDLQRAAGTYLYGRRMYETMAGWETDPRFTAASPVMRDFAEIWQTADKIVYSRTLAAVATARTRIERDFDPEVVRQLKATTAHDILIGGPDLATHAFRAGLIDQCHLFLVPIVVGGGKRSLPRDIRLDLELLEERRFGNGMVHLRYRTRS